MTARAATGLPPDGRATTVGSRPSEKDPAPSMGARTTSKGLLSRGLVRAAAGVLLLGLAQVSAAQRAPAAAPQPAPRAAIVQFEESRNANILYLQESGGVLPPSAPPPQVREARTAARAPATPAPAAAEKTASADARRAAKRRASASDKMAARP